MAADPGRNWPFFSIVIATYNRASVIGPTLASIERQTYPHYEVIVVDDGSTDNTGEVLAPFVRTGRFRVISHDHNCERAVSRNTGMAAAQGDFLTLLDNDDLMYPTNLEDAAAYARANPDARCFHNLSEHVDLAGRVVYRPRFPSLRNQLKAIASGNFMACIGDFLHRDLYAAYRFNTDPALIGSEDWEFWLRVLADHQVGRIEKVNSGVVQHPARSVHVQALDILDRAQRTAVRCIADDPRLAAVYRRYMKRLAASSRLYLAIMANAGGQHAAAFRYVRQALAEDPGIVVTRRFVRVLQMAIWGTARKR